MCGIAGKVFTDSKEAVSSDLLKRMAEAMAHRGPDDEGFSKDGPMGFAFRRLAIIDLSPTGHQPMSNVTETVTVMFNGEIYNYQTLRKECERDGYCFRSQSDTEVIIALYEKYGEGCVEHLRGMFAIAIWDHSSQKLMLIRDRVGKKPLKYFFDGQKLVFGSCLRSILCDASVPQKINREAVAAYLYFGFIPHPLTGFEGIHKLPPAHFLVFERGKIRLEKYWKLSYSPKLALSFPEACERFREILNDAIRLRMISDVSLGVFLSGGMDSGAVTAVMSQLSPHPINTFSIGFKEEKFNELPRARQVAEQYHTHHREFIVEPNALEILPELVREYEEPYADSSAIPSFYLSKMTRDHVTVALNGDGGDESLLGYRMYKYYNFSLKYEKIPHSFQAFIRGLTMPILTLHPSLFMLRLKRFLESAPLSMAEPYLAYTAVFMPDEFHSESFKAKSFIEEKFKHFSGSHPMDQVMGVDIEHRLTDDLLVKIDIATMAYGLEGRSPFLDHHLIEFLAQLPPSYKNGKRLLKSAFAKELPSAVFRGKRGFEIPLSDWFRGPLKSLLQDTLLDSKAFLHDYYDRTKTDFLVRQHLSGSSDHSRALWTLLMLEQWLKTFKH